MWSRLEKPTDTELPILQVLWKRGPSTMKHMYEGVETSDYKVVQTLVSRLVRKGLIRRVPGKKPFLYEASVTERHIKEDFLSKALVKIFDGSPSALIQHVLTLKKTSAAELDQIKKLINKHKSE